jgi:hypothetical protein
MSDVFFQDLRLPAPAIHLGVGSGSHAEQTGKVMMAYEKILLETRTGMVVVVGDLNSTLPAPWQPLSCKLQVADPPFLWRAPGREVLKILKSYQLPAMSLADVRSSATWKPG